MKRVFIIGIVGAAALMILVGALALGVMVSPVRAQVGQAINSALHGQVVAAFQTLTGQLKDEKGILVAGVFTGSPADKAGLQRGDIILDVDGKAVNTRADLNSILQSHKVGDTLKLTVQHGDTQKTVSVTLAEQPAQTQPNNNSNNNQQNNLTATPTAPKQNVPFLGIVPLGAGEYRAGKGGFFGNAQPGARIMQVVTGSPAEKAGLKVGEVILSVDGTQVSGQNTLSSLLSSHKPGDSVKLSVQATDGTQREVTVTLGNNPQQQGTAWLGVSTTNGKGRGPRGFFYMNPGPGNPNGNNGLPFSRRGGSPALVGHPGALIEQVTTGSPAEKAGLKAGQLIASVDGKAINSPQALSDAISGHKPGDTVTLSVFDPQTSKTSDMKLTLGDNPQKSGSAWMGISYTYIDLQQRPNQGTPAPGNNGTTF